MLSKPFFILAAALLLSAAMVQARPVYGRHGLVVSASEIASKAGVEILKAGGSAADAAVATAFALSVTRPYYASLGGGGFLLTRFNGQILALDYRERAPRSATRDMFVKAGKNASVTGGLAAGIPGNVQGLFDLHKKYGKLPWAQDVAPAVRLARTGFAVTEELARITRENFSDFNGAGKKTFSKNGRPLEVGDLFTQPGLAKALALIQKQGARGFYRGPVARDIVRTDKETGGILDDDDLKAYQTRWTRPLHAKILGADVYSMPLPSSGGALLLSELKLSEAVKLPAQKAYSAAEFNFTAQIMNRAFFDRQFLGDPRYSSVPAADVFSDARVAKWARTINPTKRADFDPKQFLLGEAAGPVKEKGDTTHYVVVDGQGNAVSATTTINGAFGSGVVSEIYGIVLNDEMDDFTTRPGQPNMFGLIQGSANDIAPMKTPLSSMTPTIVEKNGRFFLAVGAPGGPRIINAVYQVVYHALTTDLNLDEIVQQPRIHQQWKPEFLFYDRTLSPDTVSTLEKMGYKMKPADIARVYAIRALPGGLLEGAFDSRGEGGGAGY